MLLTPFYVMDGINEHGLAVAVAANDQTTVEPGADSPPLFITVLMRKILDQVKTVDEAVSLAEQFAPFDIEPHSLVSHLLVADPSGR